MPLDQAPDINYNQTEAIAKALVLRHSKLPDYLQNQIDDSLNKTCESKDELKEEIKIESVYKALENKYWDAFDRCDFEIKGVNLTKEEIDKKFFKL